MPNRERTKDGTFQETVTLGAVLDVFNSVRGPVITSSDVSDALECSTEAARQKLARLYDRGDVDRRKTGRTVVYWRTDTAAESGRERAVTPTEDMADRSDAPTDKPDAGATTGDLAGELRAYLEATDHPPKTNHGRDVILDVFQLLRADGPMKTGDLQEEIYPAYSDHWGSERTMWNAVDRYLEEIPGIEKAGYGEWGYAGDDATRQALDGEV